MVCSSIYNFSWSSWWGFPMEQIRIPSSSGGISLIIAGKPWKLAQSLVIVAPVRKMSSSHHVLSWLLSWNLQPMFSHPWFRATDREMGVWWSSIACSQRRSSCRLDPARRWCLPSLAESGGSPEVSGAPRKWNPSPFCTSPRKIGSRLKSWPRKWLPFSDPKVEVISGYLVEWYSGTEQQKL